MLRVPYLASLAIGAVLACAAFGAQAQTSRIGQAIAGRYIVTCRIPDDCIDPRRYPLLAAREAMRQLVDDLLGRSMLTSGGFS